MKSTNHGEALFNLLQLLKPYGGSFKTSKGHFFPALTLVIKNEGSYTFHNKAVSKKELIAILKATLEVVKSSPEAKS
jgi:gentisate 1,2-dioxygenase